MNLSQEEYCKFSKMISSGSGASSTEIFLFKKKFFLLFLFTKQQHKKYFKFLMLMNIPDIIFLGKGSKNFSCSSIVLKVTNITPEKFFSVHVLVCSNNSVSFFSNLVFSSIISDNTWYCSQHSPWHTFKSRTSKGL